VGARGREGSAPGDARLRRAGGGSALAAVHAQPIRLDSNENPYGPGPAAFEAIDNAFDIVSRYPDAPEEHLQETVTRWHGVPAGSVLMGCGSTEILRMAVREFTSPGRALVTAAPSFEDPMREAERLGAPVTAVPVDSALRLDLAGIADRSAGAGLIYLCNPNNPTGTLHPEAAIKEFVERALERSPATTILIDEAYYEYVEDPAYATSIPLAMKNPQVIVSRTFSKVFGLAGLRVGYAVGREGTLEPMRRHKLESGVNALGAAAAMAVLNRKDQVAGQRRLNHDARSFTKGWFESAGYKVVPSETNFMMVDLRIDPRSFRDACRKLDVWVGRPFPPLATHARISIGTMDEMRRAVEIFGQVLKVGTGRT
jgi:histidinol-phosphate aminotransferase